MSRKQGKKVQSDEYKKVLQDGVEDFTSTMPPLQEYKVTKACPTRQRKG